MEEEKAHHLFQHFQKTDAAAKQKQGLGFGSASAPPPPVTDSCQNPVGWEAPYKLSDKFQQAPEATTSKRSRSSHSHRYSPQKRRRANSSSSPDRPEHRSRDKVSHHRHSDKRDATARHSSHQKHRQQGRHSPSRRRRSGSLDGRHHGHHHTTRHSESSDDRNHRHPSSHHTDSKRDSHKHTRREVHSSHSHHDRHRSSHGDHRSSDQQRHSNRSNSSADQTNRAPKAPDYAKLIAGYKYMTDANRLKAVTAYKLGKTSAKDVPSQDGKPWVRFVFNNEALLEEEGAAPDSPAVEGKGPVGLGAFDFRPHRSQQIGKPAEDAHEAAMFGAPAASFDVRAITQSLPSASGSDSDERPQIVDLQQLPDQRPAITHADDAGALQHEGPAPGTANIPKMSWRERALLKKQQQMTA